MDPITKLTEQANEEIGQWLFKKNWVESDALEDAQRRFSEYMTDKDVRQGSILKILSWEMELVREPDYLLDQIHFENLGYCDLNHYKIAKEIFSEFSLRECWATLTLPFDFSANTFYVATCYYHSETTRQHWEQRLRRNIVWYACDLSTLTINLEQMVAPPVPEKTQINEEKLEKPIIKEEE